MEIVSASSRTTDRLVKPAEFAAAGIPGFWRCWGPGDTAEIGAPIAARVVVNDLL